MKAYRLLILSIFLMPLVLHAASCPDITEQIRQDTDRYGATISTQHLPWMCLTWLKQKMGSPIQKIIDANQRSYSWNCPDESENKVTIVADNTGKLLGVEGQYSSERGAGKFSAPINAENCPLSRVAIQKNKTAIPAQKTAAATMPAQQVAAATTPAISPTACATIAEQIYDITMIATDRPYAHALFPWEDKTWLEQNLGTPKKTSTAANVYYTWHCQNDDITTVALGETPPRLKVHVATICKGSNCYLASISRSNNALSGKLTKIFPKSS